MCGIAGGVGPKSPDKFQLTRQLELLEHRGPDGKGSYVDKNFSLGMCRLAINEIQDGIQPISNKNKKIHLVFNGEIYNYRILQKEYFPDNSGLMNSSESALILGLFEKFGIEFIKLIKGMFSIAIFDETTQKLFLIRDHLGKKPLFYSIVDELSIIFASETKAIQKVIPRKSFNSEIIHDLVTFGYILGTKTAFNEIRSVPPGHFLVFHSGQIILNQFWNPEFNRKSSIDYADAKEETKRLIHESVKKRLISERPVGAFLSGGIDSSVVSAHTQILMHGELKTYSVGFLENEFNEAPHAKAISKFLKTNHHEIIVSPEPRILIESISKVLDQPFADSSFLPSYVLSEFASRSVVVALSGDGGDEIFGGYDRYKAAILLNNYRLYLKFINPFRFSIEESKHFNSRVRKVFSNSKDLNNLPSIYFVLMSLYSQKGISRVIDGKYRNQNLQKIFFQEFLSKPGLDQVSRMLNYDQTQYLPNDLLIKADLASMSHGLEIRSPFLDVDLVNWVNSLPSEFKIKNGKTKFMLKDIASELIPYNLLDRPKMGFAIPRAEWLRNDLHEMSRDLLTDSTARNRGWFDQVQVQKILELHTKGSNLDSIIWPMLMLELWARNWLDQ